jgi:hypothetical protein
MTANATAEAGIFEAGIGDLSVINHVISRAVLGWPLPQRVKRLALPMLQYDAIDFEHYTALVYIRKTVMGCGVWLNEPISFGPQYCSGLLHGLRSARELVASCCERCFPRRPMQAWKEYW